MTAPTDRGHTLTTTDPRDGRVLAEYEVADAAEVRRTVELARLATRWWTDQGPRGRRRWLLEFKRALAARSDELAEVVCAETGKPRADALLEIALAVGHLDWAARNADRVLGRRRVPSGLLMADQSAYLEYVPHGVVGVIGPWNYPVFTPMGSIAYALAAGNPVVFKPSELTPGVGRWLGELWDSLAAPNRILHVLVGDGSTGAELCRAGVDKLAFTGSAATGRKVMAACAETLTPVVIEGGGKDAMIVDRDADLADAAERAVFGAMGNAGQTCAGVERIYVVDEVADRFVDELATRVRALRPGFDADSSYGPMTLPGQREIVERHVAGAVAAGGRAVVGGPEATAGRLVEPVVLVDVPEDDPSLTEETFGPTVVVNRVADLEEGVERANRSSYGLGASVFTRSRAAGLAAARALRSGAVSVNAVLAFAAVPSLPFGGSGDSGFGRIHGEDGLREFARPKSVTVRRFRSPLDLMSMNRSERDVRALSWVLKNVQSRL